MTTTYVRVRDNDTGHTRSVFESEVPHGNYEVLNTPAVDLRTGLPLPAEFGTPESLSSKSISGQQADPKKEKTHG